MLCLAALAGGCATAPSEAPPPPPVLRLVVDAPDDLRRLLERDLDLARLPVLAAGQPLPPREIERLVAAAPAQVRELVETEGWFSPEVEVQSTPGDPPEVRVSVRPGPRALVRSLRLSIDGPASPTLQQQVREAWSLPPGQPFRNPAWAGAKTQALAALRAGGHARAEWRSTLARVDAAVPAADLEVAADSGPLFRIGEVRVEGLDQHGERTVRNLLDFAPGAPATERRLLDAQERMQKSALFERASVQLDADAPEPGAAPVVVRVGERPLQEATVGLGVATDVGVRATVEHVHRRAFGRAATARNRVELGGLRQAWDGELSSHTLPGLNRNLVGGTAERLESDTDVVSSLRLRAGRAHDGPTVERLVFVEIERSLRRQPERTQKSDALSLQWQGLWRAVDDLLLPTRGRVAALQLGAGAARSDPGDNGPFARVYARGVFYRPLGAWYTKLRLEAAQVLVRDAVVPPESLLFRAGGDESVRGYRYRSLTPVENGVEVPGRVLATASAEIARPLLARLPALWGALFVDAGRAAQRWGDLRPAVGAGVGLRYRSPIGPLSLDLAYGEELRRWRLHLNVGVNF